METGESNLQFKDKYQSPSEIHIETRVDFYQSIKADPRPGMEHKRFEEEGIIPTRYEHINTHLVDLKQTLRIQDLEEGLDALAQIAQSTGPEIKQFEARKGRTFKYDSKSRVVVVIQEKPTGEEKKAPPPPAYIVSAYPIRNEAVFEGFRLRNQKGIPKAARR